MPTNMRPAAKKRDAAEHLALFDVVLGAERLTDPSGQLLVVSHGRVYQRSPRAFVRKAISGAVRAQAFTKSSMNSGRQTSESLKVVIA